MQDIKGTIRELRELCATFNIYTIQSLERSLYVQDGLTQQGLADVTNQTKQGIGKWETWMEVNGLISITKPDGRRARTTNYTTAGEEFINQLKSILE